MSKLLLILSDGLDFKDILLEIIVRSLIQKIEVIFLMIKFLASYNDKFASLVLDNAHKSAKTILHLQFKRMILHVLTSNVLSKICEDIGESNFVLLLMRDEMNQRVNK